MAGESISSMVKLDDSGPGGGKSRRKSLTGADSASSREKILPRYLRASTGSCHDFCKYGKKHDSEENAKPWKRVIKKPCDDPNLFRSLDLQQRKKTSATESKSSKSFPNSRSRTPDMPEVNKLQSATCSPNGNNSTIHGVLSEKEKPPAAKLKLKHSPKFSNRCETSDVCKPEVSTNFSDSPTSRKHEIPSEEKKTSMAKLKSSPNLKSRLSDAPKAVQKGGSSTFKKVGTSSKEILTKAKEKCFSKPRSTHSKMTSHAEKLPSASSLPSAGLSVKRSNEINDMKMGKSTLTSKLVVKKALASPRASLSPRALARATSLTARKNRNSKVVPAHKNENKVQKAETEQPLDKQDVRDNGTLEEKTLYVIKMETENILLESDKNENCAAELSPPIAPSPKSSTLPMSPLSSCGGGDEDESEYTEDDSDPEYYEDDEEETVNTGEVVLLEQKNGGRPRNGRMVSSDEKDCRPVKLSFRRGKIVDIQSESNSPRRLKFRRGRLLVGNQNVKAERRTFRMREVDGDIVDDEPGGEKVVLRHQDVQGKKDEKCLFNNVIEETASKLVETRKSKVKALVGAFETVISLQDGKPSANIVT